MHTPLRMKRMIIVALVMAIPVVGYFLYHTLSSHEKTTAATVTTQQHDIEYYTCTMHPSVREMKPGKCPLCGMELIPVYKNGAGETRRADFIFTVTPAKQQMIGVKFDQARKRKLHKIIYAVGRIDYDERKLAVVNMRVGGWIEKLYVDFTGKAVKKGQPLFQLYSPELVSAQREYLLTKQSLQVEGDVQENDDLLKNSRERLRLWGITDEQIAQLEQRGEPQTSLTMYSPISGFVIEKTALQGMRVEPGMELYKIADLSTVWILSDVYEYELPLVSPGQSAVVTLPTGKSAALEGRVTYIYPTLNPETRTARIRIELPNEKFNLKPEMYANVELHIELGEKLSIPESAVLHSGTREIVFVDKNDGKFELRFVHLGTRAEGYYEIVDGLQEGERVVVSANFLIDAESKIQGVLQRLEGGSTQAPVQHQH